MKTFPELVASYASYHRHPLNKLCHAIGIPTVTLSLFIALGWMPLSVFGMEVDAAFIFVGLIVIYYLWLDLPSALVIAIAAAPLLFLSHSLSKMPWPPTLYAFLIVFVAGWIFQILGHYFEGNRPALLDNLFQVLVAPLFLAAELLNLVGYRHERNQSSSDPSSKPQPTRRGNSH